MRQNSKTNRVWLAAQRALMSTVTVAAVAVTASACGNGVNTEPLNPAAGKESLTRGGKPSGETHAEPRPDGGGDKTGEQPAEKKQDGPVPEVLHPNGMETKLTPPGTEYRFGASAIVASVDAEGRILVWSVTPHGKKPADAAQVTLAPTASGDSPREYVCFPYDISYLGVVANHSGHNEIVPGVGHGSELATVPPLLVPANGKGDPTQRLVGGADDLCGIPQEQRLPVAQENLREGQQYSGASVAVVNAGAQRDALPTTLFYAFDYGIPGVVDAAGDVDPIFWG